MTKFSIDLVTLALILFFFNSSRTTFLSVHIKDSNMLEKHWKKFRSNRKVMVWEIWIRSKTSFLTNSWLLLAIFVRSQSYNCNAIAPIGPWYVVKRDFRSNRFSSFSKEMKTFTTYRFVVIMGLFLVLLLNLSCTNLTPLHIKVSNMV